MNYQKECGVENTEFDFNSHNEEVSLPEFQAICKSFVAQKNVCDEIEMALKKETEKLEEIKNKILEIMNKTGQDKFSVPGMGTVYLRTRATVTVPKEPDKRSQFFQYLKDKNIFDNLITVNSQTLNSYYKQEFEQAISDGNSDFKIPGIDEPYIIKSVGYRKN